MIDTDRVVFRSWSIFVHGFRRFNLRLCSTKTCNTRTNRNRKFDISFETIDLANKLMQVRFVAGAGEAERTL